MQAIRAPRVIHRVLKHRDIARVQGGSKVTNSNISLFGIAVYVVAEVRAISPISRLRKSGATLPYAVIFEFSRVLVRQKSDKFGTGVSMQKYIAC